MFLGQYEHTMDEKGRISIPARYRGLLEGGAFITQGFDQNLMVLPTSEFERISEGINKTSLTDPNARQLKRLIFGHADRIEFDKSGRILVPQFLREMAGLSGAVVVVGLGEYFEIWSPDLWKKHEDELQDSESTAQRFSALDLSV